MSGRRLDRRPRNVAPCVERSDPARTRAKRSGPRVVRSAGADQGTDPRPLGRGSGRRRREKRHSSTGVLGSERRSSAARDATKRQRTQRETQGGRSRTHSRERGGVEDVPAERWKRRRVRSWERPSRPDPFRRPQAVANGVVRRPSEATSFVVASGRGGHRPEPGRFPATREYARREGRGFSPNARSALRRNRPRARPEARPRTMSTRWRRPE